MSMIALRLSLKLLIVKSCVINMVLILKFLQILLSTLLLILMLLKEIGTYIMNLLKTLAWKMKLLLIIAIHKLKPLKVLFLISMLIFLECINLNNEEEYCKLHKHEKTRTWSRALNDLAEKVCAIYPFICELCFKEGHFEFQCSKFNDTISSLFDDSMIHPDLYDE